MSETWASAYLQIAVTFLIFGLGVPAYVFQISVRDEVKRVLRRNWFLWAWQFVVLAFTYATLLIALIWVVHPGEDAQIPPYVDAYVQGMFTVSVLVTLAFWWRQSQGPVVDRVIESLRKHVERRVDWYSSVPSHPVEDLVALGMRADDDGEFKDVILALGSIARVAQKRVAYSGRSLEGVIDGLERLMTEDARRGSGDAFVLAAKELASIIARVEDNSVPDVGRAMRALMRLGVCAAESRSEAVALALVEKASVNRVALFEMGRAAIRLRRYLIAVAALNRLEALAERVPQITSDNALGLLGLLAYFWAARGVSQERAKAFFGRSGGNFSPSLDVCVSESIEFYADQGDYPTVDVLRSFLAEYYEAV